MSNIIMDGRYLLALDALTRIGEYAGRDPEWIAVLWQELMEEPALMKEFMYYVDHHNFEDRFNCHGYCMTDLYVFQMSRYNLIRDIGKNEEGEIVDKEFVYESKGIGFVLFKSGEDASKAKDLLPLCDGGFFFGVYDSDEGAYDKFYFEDLENELVQLTEVLNKVDWENECLEYYDWW